MSLVTLSQIEEGDDLAIAAVNADINALITATTSGASAGINEVNIREEGLDERSIVARAITPTAGTVELTTFTGAGPYTTSDAATPTVPVQPDGAADLAVGPFTFNNSTSNDRLIVRLSFDYEGAIPDGFNLAFWRVQFGYSTDYAGVGTGSWTWLNDTKRRVSWYDSSATGGKLAGSFTLAHRVVTAINSSALYFGVRIFQTNASVTGTSDEFTMRYIYLYGKVRRK